ncbi:hypothetical protein OG361_37080 [Streptomyces sp. NBC_00090]|uniref:hypothetical protein n=1 Tax=Streptomyces sp. NBC_00090 TaxID=2903619 RepID=UPI0032540B1B
MAAPDPYPPRYKEWDGKGAGIDQEAYPVLRDRLVAQAGVSTGAVEARVNA